MGRTDPRRLCLGDGEGCQRLAGRVKQTGPGHPPPQTQSLTRRVPSLGKGMRDPHGVDPSGRPYGEPWHPPGGYLMSGMGAHSGGRYMAGHPRAGHNSGAMATPRAAPGGGARGRRQKPSPTTGNLTLVKNINEEGCGFTGAQGLQCGDVEAISTGPKKNPKDKPERKKKIPSAGVNCGNGS